MSPLAANVTNCLGVIPGSLSGAYGLRTQLVGQRAQLLQLGSWVGVGSALGAVALLTLPSTAFDQIIPVLVALAGLLVLVQPLVVRRLTPRGEVASSATGPVVGAIGVYSGYFGAAQGVLLIGALGLLTPQPLKQVNAVKNILAVAGNGVAGIIYAFVAPVNWTAAGLLAVGSAAGGPIGAALAKRVQPGPLRVGIAVVALAVAVHLSLSAY